MIILITLVIFTNIAQGLLVFKQIDVNGPSTNENGTSWCNRLENLLLGMGIKDKKRKSALLLYYAGEDVNDIFDKLECTGDDYKTARVKFNEYFAAKKCSEFDIYKFRQAKQESNESFNTYYTRLRKLAADCYFDGKSKEIINSTRM